MIRITVGAYRSRFSTREAGLALPFEIDGDEPVGRVEVSMDGDGAGPYLQPRFSEARDGRSLRGLFFKPERPGRWFPLVKAFRHPHDVEPAVRQRGAFKVEVTGEDVFLPADPPGPAPFSIRAVFYYGWFQNGAEGWGEIGTRYSPLLGRYDLLDRSVVLAHQRMLEWGRIDAGIATWWGPGHKTDTLMPALLEAAEGTPLRWCAYREPYSDAGPNPSVEEIRRDLAHIRERYAGHPNYLKIGGRFVVFVYNHEKADACVPASRWREANDRGDAYVVVKAVPGYEDCPAQPDGWHEYGPASDVVTTWDRLGRLHSYNVSPGFWRRDEREARLERDLERFRRNVRDMVASRARWQIVTSFNEWGEGTSVEPAAEWASPSGYGHYLDVLHEAVL